MEYRSGDRSTVLPTLKCSAQVYARLNRLVDGVRLTEPLNNREELGELSLNVAQKMVDAQEVEHATPAQESSNVPQPKL